MIDALNQRFIPSVTFTVAKRAKGLATAGTFGWMETYKYS
jgi:hypothetical protein